MFTPETGRMAGKKSKRTKDYKGIRQMIQNVVEGQQEQVESALNTLYHKSPYRYLQIIDRLLSHTLPKPTGSPEVEKRETTFPKEIIFNVLPPEADTNGRI